MTTVLGLNAVFHDSAAAIVVDGELVAAAEEERFTRREHGKSPLPFSTWELPVAAIEFCLGRAGVVMEEVDAVAYSYDPRLAPAPAMNAPWDDGWEPLRTIFARRAPRFVRARWPRFELSRLRYVAHHVAHAASAWRPAPFDRCAVLVLDGRGEAASSLAGVARDGRLDVMARQQLPHSLGRWYEGLTEHLGFRSSSEEDKVMNLAAHGEPTLLDAMRQLVKTDGTGGFTTVPTCWDHFAPAGAGELGVDARHADVARSAQERLEEVVVELAGWLRRTTGEPFLVMAGGVANSTATSRLWEASVFDDIWVPPAAGDAGTAIGAAVEVAAELGDRVQPMSSAALGPEWPAQELASTLRRCAIPFDRPADLAATVADLLAAGRVVGWFQGRSEFGSRALGHRTLLAHPADPDTRDRLERIAGPQWLRPARPLVASDRAAEIVAHGRLPNPYGVFTHRFRDEWTSRLSVVAQVDGTARVQTIDRGDEPLLHRTIGEFAARTGLPAVAATPLRTARHPTVDSPDDALECFGAAPIDALALGPFLVRRASVFMDPASPVSVA